MTYLWSFTILLTVLEIATSKPESKELPLSRSLGYSMSKKFGTNLEDARLSQEYMELYQEMMKASYETMEGIQEGDHRGVEKDYENDVRKRGAGSPDRRHCFHQRHSAVGHRRARSQASRRDKLNSQSLRSHQLHIRRSGHHHLELDID